MILPRGVLIWIVPIDIAFLFLKLSGSLSVGMQKRMNC
jgi:hypothetical protein